MENNIVLITGGNSGIGYATVLKFVDLGAKIVVFDKETNHISQLAEKYPDQIMVVNGDVTKLGDLDHLYDEIKNKYGQLNVVFANAGIFKFLFTQDTDEELYDDIMNTNLKGVFFTVQKALSLLKDGSSIVVNSSIAHMKAVPAGSVYAASKAGARSLVRTWMAELAPRNIRVNSVSPGPIETPIYDTIGLNEEQKQGFREELKGKIPLARLGEAEEVAEAVVFLASEKSSFINGEDILIDGGIGPI